MDIVLEVVDTYLADYVYAYAHPARTPPYDFPNPSNGTTAFQPWQYKPATHLFSFEPSAAAYQSAWLRDNIWRQSLTLFFIYWLFGLAVYFIFASLSFIFIFDKKTMKHPKFLKNQIALEIKQSCMAFPVMAIMTFPIAVAEIRGYSKLYDTTEEGPGRWYDWFQFPLFIFFTDFCIYWIHRWLHHPQIYKHLHKPHHKWIMPTPFASHAFHPLDGYAQGFPYHVFPFIFPLQKLAYVLGFIFVNFWTIMIHDGEYVSDNPIINGAACHSVHHYAFNYNFGQYTTLWDRLGGSYKKPDPGLFSKSTKQSDAQWQKQVEEMEKMVIQVEGTDDRVYDPVDSKKTK